MTKISNIKDMVSGYRYAEELLFISNKTLWRCCITIEDTELGREYEKFLDYGLDGYWYLIANTYLHWPSKKLISNYNYIKKYSK
jgi:hypothetical protein